MNTYFFHPEIMSKYYNCSGRSFDEWAALGQPNIPLGILYAGLGFIYWITYLPFIIVFIKSDITKHSCYKIMFYLGIVDMICLPLGSFCGGYFAAIGVVYCMYPNLLYFIGSFALSCWCSGSTACMLLGFNRCLDLCFSELAQTLFSGKRTFVWLLIPTGIFFYYTWFHTTALFSSILYAYFFDPFVGTPERNGLVDSIHYPHNEHSIHNIIVVAILSISYCGLCAALTIRTRGTYNVKISKMQRQTFIQSTLICGGTFVAAVIYVYMQFFYTPIWVVVIGEIAWQFSHGCVGIIYFCFNPTMRKEAKKIFCHSSSSSTEIHYASTTAAAAAFESQKNHRKSHDTIKSETSFY